MSLGLGSSHGTHHNDARPKDCLTALPRRCPSLGAWRQMEPEDTLQTPHRAIQYAHAPETGGEDTHGYPVCEPAVYGMGV